MNGIIIVFSKLEDAKKIQSVLNRNGYEETTACSTGAQALGHLSRYSGGIVICGYRLADMYYTELNEYLPENFKMLLIGSSRAISQCEASIVSVEVPLKVYDLINTVQILWGGGGQSRRTGAKSKRSASDRAVIDKAKELLMERNHISEPDAHYYLQKISMDAGRSMVETARMVLCLIEGE